MRRRESGRGRKKMKLNREEEDEVENDENEESFDWDESEDGDDVWEEEEEEEESTGSSFEMYYKNYDEDDEDDEIFKFKRKQFADLVVFDDELTPKQGVNIEKALGDKLRVCDRTALILDIFSQRRKNCRRRHASRNRPIGVPVTENHQVVDASGATIREW